MRHSPGSSHLLRLRCNIITRLASSTRMLMLSQTKPCHSNGSRCASARRARIDAGVDADAAGVAAFEQARGVAQFLLQADKVLMQQGFIALADFRARQLGHGMQQQIDAADDFFAV